MSLTLADAVTQVRRNVNEATAAFWTDTEIEDWIKEGVRVFSSKTLMVEDTQNIDPLIAGQLSYSSSDEPWIADIVEPYAAIYYDGLSKYKGLMRIHPRQIGNLALGTSGPPKYYCLHDKNLYVFPLTSATVVAAGATITVLYSKETEDIAELADEFQHLPIIYATAKAKQKDEKFGEANALMAQFYQESNFERVDKNNREADTIEDFKIKKARGMSSANG